MCRSIKTLRGAEPPATEAEVEAAAVQYVRKISGYRSPSKKNSAAFESAVGEIAAATERLLAGLEARAESREPRAESREPRAESLTLEDGE